MADQQSQGNQRTSSYLSPNQQDLLLAALNSQAGGQQDQSQQAAMNGANENGLYISPQQATFNDFDDFSPDIDYLDGDGFDFENADLGGEMIGALPGESQNGTELHEKRKNSEEYDANIEGDAKRQETQDGEKSAKKPGRKPLTSEPTTKRKAQNRAAQRAFRERKEAHLKDLETKVSELTKAQEADKHENGLLKAQVDRLQVELREYRKRLSLNGSSSANRSPPATGYGQTRSNSNPSGGYGNNSFQFDFPKFGALPGSQIFGNQNFSNNSNPALAQRSSVTPPTTQSPTNGSFSGPSQQAQYGSRQNSIGRSMSPGSITGQTTTGSPGQMANASSTFAPYSTNDNMHGFASTLPPMSGTSNDPFGDLFSPSILKSASVDGNSNYFTPPTQVNGGSVSDPNGGDSTAGLNRVFQFNSSSGSDTASPSASSASQWNGANNSSTGTSPEPSHGSPMNKVNDKFTNGTRQQSPLAVSSTTAANSNNLFSTTNDFGMPSLETFDPVLFGDYRESNDAIVGGGDFTGGFFDEALQPFDYSSPTNLFGILQSPQPKNQQLQIGSTGAANAPTPSANLMAEIDKARDGGDDDYGLPSTATAQPSRPLKKDEGKFISCNNIWNQLQSNPDFQEGKFDLDSLCSELKAKARCSESGVLVDQDHVNAALKKLGKKDDKGKEIPAPQGLMFEQESWDNVLKKLGSNKA